MADPRNPEQNAQANQNQAPAERTQLGQHQDKQAHLDQISDKGRNEQNPDKQATQTASPGRDRYASGQQDDDAIPTGSDKASEEKAGGTFAGQPEVSINSIYSEIGMLRTDLRKLMDDISGLTTHEAERLYRNIRDNGPDIVRERVRDQPIASTVLAFLIGAVLTGILRR